jgi:predicted DsbA family dithiol-disulfide isomerase
MSGFYEQLRRRGKELDIVFGDRTLLSNSEAALEASEYARDVGKYDLFHENMFHAYFTEVLDIGNIEVIADVASKSGIDSDKVRQAVKNGRYRSRLDEAIKEAQAINLTGVPTFIINTKYKVVGAQPADVFRDLINKIEKDK